jgi:hypothetical protein
MMILPTESGSLTTVDEVHSRETRSLSPVGTPVFRERSQCPGRASRRGAH